MIHLLSFILAMCPAHFHFSLVTYSTMSATLVLCLMIVLRILYFGVTVKVLEPEELRILPVETFATCILVRKPVTPPGSGSFGSTTPTFGRMLVEYHVLFYKAPPTPMTSV